MVLKTGCTHHRRPIPWLSWCAVSSVRGHYWVGFFRIHIDNVFVGCMVYVESIVTGEWKSKIFEETKHVSWIHLEENNMNGGKILEGNCFYKFCVFFRERQIVWVWTTHQTTMYEKCKMQKQKTWEIQKNKEDEGFVGGAVFTWPKERNNPLLCRLRPQHLGFGIF